MGYDNAALQRLHRIHISIIRPDDKAIECIQAFNSGMEAMQHAVGLIDFDIDTDEYNHLTKK